MSKPTIWAHRGASDQAAENTMPAFELAIRQQADGIETDVQRTADGELVLIHDEQTVRTTGQPGWVHACRWTELKALNGAAFRPELPIAGIPRLQDLLDLIKPLDLILNIELKNGLIQADGLEKQVWDEVCRFGLQERVIFSSFNHYSMRLMRNLSDNARCGLLYQCGIVDPWLYAARVGAQALHPHWANLKIPNLTHDCHESGISVHTWTVDDPDHIRMAAKAGVDAIITNRPELARHTLSSIPIG